MFSAHCAHPTKNTFSTKALGASANLSLCLMVTCFYPPWAVHIACVCKNSLVACKICVKIHLAPKLLFFYLLQICLMVTHLCIHPPWQAHIAYEIA